MEPDLAHVKWLIDGYDVWLEKERVRITEGRAVDLLTVETAPWGRMGVPATFVHTHARGDLCSLYLLEIPAGKATESTHHLYEAVYFVLSGQGTTTVHGPHGASRSFEWGRGSLFGLPINAPYRFFNASGTQPARIVAVTNLPMVMKQFRNAEFVFGSEQPFAERWGRDQFFRGEGRFIETREQRHMWETNFVADLMSFDRLRSTPNRGSGSANIQFVLGETTMHAHVSEVAVGSYKKAHVHEAGTHILQLGDGGYSLYWYADGGEQEYRKVRWSFGMLHSPGADEWHQHFNIGDQPSRYLAMSYGGYRYPFGRADRANILRDYRTKSVVQIEYADEDPAIRAMFDSERAAHRAGQR
jgi:mannose-6-phosphate isomerase-like protein (cupin superfamily)